MNIIVRLDEMMARRKMRLHELAEKVGITEANLSILKNDKAKAIRFSTLALLCKALDCQPGDLLAFAPEEETGRYERESLTSNRDFRTTKEFSMYHKKISRLTVLLFLVCGTLVATAMQRTPQKDPFQPIRYARAFNQESLWLNKYRSLMELMGCGENVFGTREVPSFEEVAYPVFDEAALDWPTIDRQLAAYRIDCMSILNRARQMALAEPGIYAAIEMGLMITSAGLAMRFLGSESVGGSFAGFAAIIDSVHLMSGAIQSGYNLFSWPDNTLEQYEDCFACNKCFIPRAMWPKIIRELISARQNEYSREVHTGFLQFALGFTVYKPLPKLHMQAASLDDVKEILSKRIRAFFERYGYEDLSRELYAIELNVAKFIDQLAGQSMQAPRYIYLHGSGGIGKTYFVEQLAQWIEELLPGSLNFEQIVINDAQELEGTASRPGALLKVLYNRLRRNKRGSVVVFDEANLNDPMLVAAAKRTFNLDRSRLATAYLGEGSEGAGIELAMPPMLIFVASNDSIADEALAGRFDVINFPRPSKQALLEHALSALQASGLMKRSRRSIDIQAVRAWVETLDEKQLNYRFVAGNVEAEFLTRDKENHV